MATKLLLWITFFVFVIDAGVEKASALDFLSNLRGSHRSETIAGINMLKKYLEILTTGKPKWLTYNLTFAFAPGTREDAIDPVANALEDWSSISPFRFSVNNIYDHADFKINFQPFDGPHQPLAYSIEPRYGRLHFNVHENWVNGKVPGGFDIESVASHEIGHLLGLEHSKDQNAIMYAYFGPNTVKIKLQPDDIQGLKVLYGF